MSQRDREGERERKREREKNVLGYTRYSSESA